jgi:pseudaminic acid cytidylyltransferase
MKNIAIIPARGGSKRIPKKNIRNFIGQPIIAYSIECAIKSRLFDEIMVSTDDEDIARIAIQYGAKVPFMRSKKNSNDFAGTAEVLIEVLDEYSKSNINFENCCCIYPTAPFVTEMILKNAFYIFKTQLFDSFFPVIKFSYPVQRSLIIEDGETIMKWPENYKFRSQDLAPVYHDAGQFYWLKTNTLIEKKVLWPSKAGSIIVSELQAHDIDTETDWRLAELKFKLAQTM